VAKPVKKDSKHKNFSKAVLQKEHKIRKNQRTVEKPDNVSKKFKL
jgi:hypothetical protein